ncbi:MAG: pirin family protein [Oceanospirillaceae bacterium]|nr:pirin family protein [Oceanospirillaceae bacterium]
MSTLIDTTDQESICITQPCPAIALLIKSKEKDLGGFSVRRSLPVIGQKKVGPWIFFDHMGPATFTAGQGVNVRPHPHINIATVTYLFEGEILHRDSAGYVQVIQPGDINMMVAGSGIAHSERERPEIRNTERKLHGLQLWMGLPEEDEETQPMFYHYRATDIPATISNDIPVRVMIGSAFGVTSPVKTFADTLYAEARLKSGQILMLPHAEERAVYVASGSVKIDGELVPEHSMAILTDKAEISLLALQNTRIAIIGGAKMGTRYLDWNFASSRKSRIEQAKEDWKARRFPSIPDDDQEFIPYPT